jgi:hypothetical protein
MSAIANVVLNDAATTPVAHTFSPDVQGLRDGQQIAIYVDRAANAGTPVGFYKLEMTMSRPSANRKTYRVGLKMSMPVLEVTSNSTVSGIAPAPTIAYSPLIQMDVVIPERASAQARKDLRKMFYEALNHAQVKGAIEDLDFPI